MEPTDFYQKTRNQERFDELRCRLLRETDPELLASIGLALLAHIEDCLTSNPDVCHHCAKCHMELADVCELGPDQLHFLHLLEAEFYVEQDVQD